MKSEWEFRFEARDFIFDREITYEATTDQELELGGNPPERIKFLVKISPEDKEESTLVQHGVMYITLPHSHEETKDFALHAARMMEERISFQSGSFEINYGMLVCKHIAETPDEEKEVGEKAYFVELSLQEVLPSASFDSSRMEGHSSSHHHYALMSQFNETKSDKSPIRQFLGFFRILESIYYGSNNSKSIKQVFRSHSELKALFNEVTESGDFNLFVDQIVNVRHRCAHLKFNKGFGYTPADPAIESEIKPYLEILEVISRLAIETLPEGLHNA